jgi:hypothetical protein
MSMPGTLVAQGWARIPEFRYFAGPGRQARRETTRPGSYAVRGTGPGSSDQETVTTISSRSASALSWDRSSASTVRCLRMTSAYSSSLPV